MPTKTSAAGGGGEASPQGQSTARARKARPPVAFVHDNGQILLKLLRGRAKEEDRRRFVMSLRRLRGAAVA